MGSEEESPVLLEGLPLGEIDPVKQLTQQLDACALDEPMAALIKTEETTTSGELASTDANCWVTLSASGVGLTGTAAWYSPQCYIVGPNHLFTADLHTRETCREWHNSMVWQGMGNLLSKNAELGLQRCIVYGNGETGKSAARLSAAALFGQACIGSCAGCRSSLQAPLAQCWHARAGSLAGAFPPSSPSRNDGSPKIQEAVTPDMKGLTRSALKKAARADVHKAIQPQAPAPPCYQTKIGFVLSWLDKK